MDPNDDLMSASSPSTTHQNPTPLSHTSPSQSNSTSHQGPTTDSYRIIRKRNRIPLSCGPCRHRKLKCNRQSPCDNCVKRGEVAGCAYAAPASKRRGTKYSSNSAGSGDGGNGGGGVGDDMQARIDRLEGLVLSLMTVGGGSGSAAQAAIRDTASSAPGSGSLGANLDSSLDDNAMYLDTGNPNLNPQDPSANINPHDPTTDPDSETDHVTKSLGILKVDQERQKTFYIGEAHWAALLNEISEVKNYFASHKKEYEAQMEKIALTRRNAGEDTGASGHNGPALLFGMSVPPPRAEIVRNLPSRYMSDILVGRYFNTYDPATHILHGPSFQRQYEAYWAEPSGTSIVWIGMLFAIMRLAMLSYAREGDEPPEFRDKANDMACTFRTQMAHCLVTADYTKPHAFIIETLIFHLHAEYTCNRDTEASVWVLMGIIVRLAMRMGYHRDSKFFPDLTPFQGEMRRRVWSYVRTGDLLFSFQIALPPMVRLGDSDTDLPRNIYDTEFDEGSTTLPPPRPQSEATPVSYLIAKSRLSFGFGRVLEEVHGVNRKSYEEVLKIDRALRDMYEGVPGHLKVRPMEEQMLAPTELTVARFALATVYHKGLCVLHRRYVRLARVGNRYMYSRRTCLESAMRLLEFQVATQGVGDAGGRRKGRSLRSHISSLTAHDYLLAGTLVCMDLYSSKERAQKESDSGKCEDAGTPSTNSNGATPASSLASGGSRGSTSSSVDGGGAPYIPGLPYTRDDVIGALERSRDIWLVQRDYSMEAYKASELLNVLLLHLKTPFQDTQQPNGPAGAGRSGKNDEQTAAMTLGMLQAGGSPANISQGQAVQATQLAQQAQMQMPGGGSGMDGGAAMPMAWDKATVEAYLAGQQMGATQTLFGMSNAGGIQDANDWTSVFGAGNGMFPQTIFGPGGGTSDSGGTPAAMNIDWEAWDQYMQPANLSLDPMANLWPTGNRSPNSGGNYFSQSPPDQRRTQNQNQNQNENQWRSDESANLGMKYGFLADPSQNQGQGQVQNENNDGGAGDTFMGASTPGPGGVGMYGWKWTAAMDPNK